MPPKIIWQIPQVKEYFYMIHYILNPKKGEWDWRKRIHGEYPGLEKRLKETKKKEIELKFFKEEFKKRNKEMQRKKEIFQNAWNKINDEVMNTLAEIIEQKWPIKDKIIKARITLNPICPRDIKGRTFDIYYKVNTETMKAIAMHELLHFIYFEKWRSVFPQTKEKEFNHPYLIWHLSEMVPEIILNDKRMQKIHKHKHRSYEEYEKCKIKGKSILTHLQQLYQQRKDFKDFLKKSYSFVKKHEKELRRN